MPRNGSGSYSLPQPAFVPGTTISSSAVNSNFSDIATALSGSVAADGQTPISGAFKFVAGSAALPSITFFNDDTTGLYLASAGVLGLSGAGVQTVSFDGTAVGASDNVLLYASGAIPCPVGSIIDFVGITAPAGWLLLYGQVLAQASYPGLFAVVSTTYNTGGEGAGNFRLPDCRGRIGVGKDDMGGSAASRITAGGCGVNGTTLGANGGEQTHVLLEAELATHSHGGVTGNTSSLIKYTTNSANWGGGGNATLIALGTSGTSTATGEAHSHTITADGSNTAHNNVQPIIVFNKIIFAGR